MKHDDLVIDEAQPSRLPGLPVLRPLSSGFASATPPVALPSRAPVLVAERGVCERSSPAGHGWPAEWAGMSVLLPRAKRCATSRNRQSSRNRLDSRRFVALATDESPPNDEESRILCVDDGIRRAAIAS